MAAPQDIEAEQTVLSCLITNPAKISEALFLDLDVIDFHRPVHAAAWQALVNMDAAGEKTIDVAKLAAKVPDLDPKEAACWLPINGHSTNIGIYIANLKAVTAKREALREGHRLIRENDPGPGPDGGLEDEGRPGHDRGLARDHCGVDDLFWEARPVLTHIRDYARAQMASPWATFGVVAARVVCQVPAAVTLPPVIYGHASLNLTVALVGRSGGGKGGTSDVGKNALRFPAGPVFHRHTLGTGHAIAHGFGTFDKAAAAVKRHADSILFTIEEIDHLAGHAQMNGSTTLAELRRFSMGEALGSLYVDPTRRVQIDAHTYRGAVIVGVQPDRAGVLIDNADGGTPQRFLWFPTTDPDMPDRPPARPDPLDWTPPTQLPRPETRTGLRPIDICATAADAIRQARRAAVLGEGDPLDGHALLTRERAAAVLGLLDGRYSITDDDWNLAAAVMAVSDDTRQNIVATLKAKAKASNQARGRAEAEREEVKDQQHAARVARRIGAKLKDHGDWMTGAQLRKKITSKDRAHFETAVDNLTHAGQIDAEQVPGTGQSGWRYRWCPR